MLETCSEIRRMRLYRPEPTGHARMPPGLELLRDRVTLKRVSTPHSRVFREQDLDRLTRSVTQGQTVQIRNFTRQTAGMA
jgi:hypothetical protein